MKSLQQGGLHVGRQLALLHLAVSEIAIITVRIYAVRMYDRLYSQQQLSLSFLLVLKEGGSALVAE